jgi:N6-L-threonylcarbamoyladenine synthase
VYLGLKFPCGEEMEKLSDKGKLIDIKIPISIKNKYWTNLSGLENYFLRLIYSKNYPVEDIIHTLFHTVSMVIEKMIRNFIKDTNINKVLFTGGVSANNYIRKYLINAFTDEAIIIFPKRELSTDNAIGIAYLGMTRKGHMEVNE